MLASLNYTAIFPQTGQATNLKSSTVTLKENRKILNANTEFSGRLNLAPTSLWQGFRKKGMRQRKQRKNELGVQSMQVP